LNGGRWQIVGEFLEVESGKRASRLQLNAAISTRCRRAQPLNKSRWVL
jgi:hypothetical protein